MHNSPERNGDAIAELHKVTKRYGKVTAVDDIELSIRRGEVLALLGPNGAGKTTSINMLLGLVRPTVGEARLFGRPPRELAARRRVGAMLQEARFDGRVRVSECLALYAGYYPAPLAIDAALRLAGIGDLAKRPITKLSGGQKQRLMFALALVGNPELLFLDEPTAGLDVEGRRAVWAALRELIGAGRTIVLTTHYLEEADALADRIVVINHGRVIAQGSPAEIKARAALVHIRCITHLSIAQVQSLAAVKAVRADGARLEITTMSPEEVLREMLWQDPELTDLEVTGARLEDAFVELTREEEIAA